MRCQALRKMMDPPLDTNKIYFGFSTKVVEYQEFLHAFSKGLELTIKG